MGVDIADKNQQPTINIHDAGRLVNLNFKAFNKLYSGLITKSLENPHSVYSNRCQ